MKLSTIGLTVVLMFGGQLAHAAKPNSRTDIVVIPATALPELAQQASQDLLLYYGSSNPYLYLEQQQGERMVVFDLSDPAHIKLVASVNTGVSKAYDFIQPIGGTSELIRFRDGSGIALLNMQHAKAPRMMEVEPSATEPIEMLGDSGYLAVALLPGVQPVDQRGRDVRVVDSVTDSRLLATVTGVTRRAERTETGTIFLLGDRGLTVVRRLDVEQQYALDEARKSQN